MGADLFLLAFVFVSQSAVVPSRAQSARSDTSAQLRRDAEAGRAAAQFTLGESYENDDYIEALKWYELAADQGLAEAEYAVGMANATGRSIPENDGKAFDWFRRAADQGFAKAEFTTGLALLAGKGVDPSRDQAIDWFGKSAAQGYAPAQFSFAYYHYLLSTEHDPFKAVEWLRRAAEQGYQQAQYVLGSMLRHGTDNPLADSAKDLLHDDVEASKWFIVCGGHEANEEELLLNSWISTGLFDFASPTSCSSANAAVQAVMTPEQIAQAQADAIHWIDQFGRGHPR